MTQIEKIKAEIKRRMLEDYNSSDAQKDEIAQGVCAGILTFINSLPQEEVGEDLKLASERYACKFSSSKYGHDKVKDAVVWGANWQKEQMLKDAKCVKVYDDWSYGKDADRVKQPAVKLRDQSLQIGSEVKLIIIEN